MPVMPRAGQLARREQTQQAQREKAEEMTGQQRYAMQQQKMLQQQYMQQQMAARREQQLQRGAPAADLTYEQRHAMRRQNELTNEEMEEGVEGGTAQGRGFRIFFIVLVLTILGLLMLVKVDQEVGIEMPDSLKKMAEDDAADKINLNEQDQAQLDKYLNELHVNKPESHADDGTLTKEQRRKRVRRDREALKQKLKEKSKAHDDEFALVHCGKSCEAEGKQIQMAMELLDQQVDQELYTSLFPGKTLGEVKGRSKAEIEKAFKAQKEEIEQQTVEAGSEEELDKQLILQDLRDAKDILTNTESRAYYELFGLKPPVAMRKMSARHGGWGQELILRTHFHKLILTWMSFFDNSRVDLFVVVFVFTCLFLAPALARLPQTVAMAQRMTQEWEDMAELEKKAKGRD